MSSLGADFPKDVFARTPLGIIRRVLSAVDNEDQRQANINSVTAAQLVQVVLSVAQGFAGGKAKPLKTQPQDFLPFPNWSPDGEMKEHGPNQATKFVITQLMRDGLLPTHIFAALLSPPERGR